MNAAQYLAQRAPARPITLKMLERAQWSSEGAKKENIYHFLQHGVLPDYDADGKMKKFVAAKKEGAPVEDRKFSDDDSSYPKFPKFPGSIGELAAATCPDVPYEFKIGAALAHFGLIRSGLDTLADESWIQPRFFVALVTGAGKGKTAAINEIGKAFKPFGTSYKSYSSIDSGPALCDAFSDLQRSALIQADGTDSVAVPMQKILLAPDEIKNLFEKSKVTANSKNTLGHNILELYETNVIGNRARTAKVNIQIETAHLAIVGGATPAGYISMWTGTGGGSDGMQTRITTIGIAGSKVPSKQRPTNLEAFTQAQQRLTDQAKAPATAFPWADDAFALYDEWWTAKSADNVHAVRVDGIVKKVLIILCRTNDLTEITLEITKAAIAFGDYIIASREKHNPLDASSPVQSSENRIIAAYTKHGHMSQNECRMIMKPERFTGGYGPWLMAFKNLTQGGRLKLAGQNRSGAHIFKLDDME